MYFLISPQGKEDNGCTCLCTCYKCQEEKCNIEKRQNVIALAAKRRLDPRRGSTPLLSLGEKAEIVFWLRFGADQLSQRARKDADVTKEMISSLHLDHTDQD